MAIVGLTGQKCSGKGEVVEILKRFGWGHISLSHLVCEELEKEGIENSRANIIKKANEMRESGGPGVLAKKAKEKIELAGGGRWVVESIRHPDEVRILQEFPDFELWRISAPQQLRYKRSVERGIYQEGKDSLEKFQELEEKENQKSGAVQRIKDCEKLAKVTIENAGTLDELKKKLNELL